MTRTVPVKTSQAEYDVTIGAGTLSSVGQIVASRLPNARRIHAVIDTGVPSKVIEQTLGTLTLDGYVVSRSRITPSETVKIAETWISLLGDAANARLERSDVILAIGGGIVGDVAGFVAASYRRGLAVVQCPTTLLSMVDASVGGKTGINLEAEAGLLKNAVGAFYQPIGVFADVDTLDSLTDRVFRAGLAECVKHAMLSADFGDPSLANWMDENTDQILARESQVLTEFVARNVAIKAAVVHTDEKETSAGDMGRALLNLGHTFAHAIETYPTARVPMGTDESPIMHGEAVALGLVCAATLSEQLGTTKGLLGPLVRRLESFGLPTRCGGIDDTRAIMDRMVHDKKAVGGSVRFVIPVSEGSCRVISAPDVGVIAAAIEAVRA